MARNQRGGVKRKTTRRGKKLGEPVDQRSDDGLFHVVHRPNPAFGPPPSIVETVLFTRIGHTFTRLPDEPGFDTMYAVQDFLLDQTGVSGCDGRVEAMKYFDLTTTTRYRFNVYPRDRAKRVKVVTPPSVPYVFLGLNAGRQFVNATSDVMDHYTPITFLQDLIGPVPGFTYDSFAIGRNTNHWVEFTIQARAISTFQFFGFVSIGTYPMRTFDPGAKAYKPFTHSVPPGLGTSAGPYLMFSYLTRKPDDPGPFVSLT